ncbi:MAG: ferrous iron transporter B [Oscillospiraceae bacterium]|nr:ferrous iron transporter B [Oscillospiraceae bacterium]
MGLTKHSTGSALAGTEPGIRRGPSDRLVALAGNPNVGKSSVFNALTGMNQHTGNWPGKTVAVAHGRCRTDRAEYTLVDLPGSYSLIARSPEEALTRDFICFDSPDAVIVVCDATCLERGLNLALQTMETSPRVLLCVNLMDEARRKRIAVDLDTLSEKLGVPVVGTSARDKRGLSALTEALDALTESPVPAKHCRPRYCGEIERAIAAVEPVVRELSPTGLDSRWLSLRLLDGDEALISGLKSRCGIELLKDTGLKSALNSARAQLEREGISPAGLSDRIVSATVGAAEDICSGVITYESSGYSGFDRRADRIITGRHTAYPLMLLLLAFIFWLTISGADYPTQLLSDVLFRIQDALSLLFRRAGAPEWLHGLLVMGVYRVLAWVISVMLPPMALFFPLFTILEDLGYLPRVAYNLDRPFKRCCACGKQALTM